MNTSTPPSFRWALGLFGLNAQALHMFFVAWVGDLARIHAMTWVLFVLPAIPFMALGSCALAVKGYRDIANLAGIEEKAVLKVYRGLMDFVVVLDVVLMFVSLLCAFFVVTLFVHGIPGL